MAKRHRIIPATVIAPKARFKITGPVSLGGKNPGETFTLAMGADGYPLDLYWRRRLQDEERYGGGHVTRVEAAPPAPVSAPDPIPTPVPVSAPTDDPQPEDDAAAPASSRRKKG